MLGEFDANPMTKTRTGHKITPSAGDIGAEVPLLPYDFLEGLARTIAP